MFPFLNSSKNKSITLKDLTPILDRVRLPIGLVTTPINLAEEKAKFMDSANYNPQFKYEHTWTENSKIFKELEGVSEVTDVDPRISEFYIQLIEDKKLADRLFSAIGDNSLFTKYSLQKHRFPTPVLFRNAARILRGKVENYNVVMGYDSSMERKLNYEEIVKIFRHVFDRLGLEDWAVEKSKNIAKGGMKVGVKNKRVFVHPDFTRTPLKLKNSLIHEMTHVIRTINGAKSGIPALAKPNLANYLELEEGLTTYNCERAGVMTMLDLKKRAGKTWAIYSGVNMSFRELYNCALAFTTPNVAFDTVYRVKRGLSDTSAPGIYSKDAVYFRGFRRVRRYLKDNPESYSMLLAGKIGFKQISWVDEGLIPKPKLVVTAEDFLKILKEAGI